MTIYYTSKIGDTGYTEKEERLFVRAYLYALLWSSVAIDPETGEDIEGLECETFSIETENSLTSEALEFLTLAKPLLDNAFASNVNYDIEQAGHDFALTRNQHGVGYWDRGLGSIGDDLTKLSIPLNVIDLYIGDKGYVHAQ